VEDPVGAVGEVEEGLDAGAGVGGEEAEGNAVNRFCREDYELALGEEGGGAVDGGGCVGVGGEGLGGGGHGGVLSDYPKLAKKNLETGHKKLITEPRKTLY
jgi:hypothetical protein